MSSQRPPGSPTDPSRGGDVDASVAPAARTQRTSAPSRPALPPGPRSVSSSGSHVDDEPQSIPDEDFIDAPTNPSDLPPRIVAATTDDAPAARGTPAVGSTAPRPSPASNPPSDDDDPDGGARRHAADDDALPERERPFGPYTLLRRLAFGGMGEVFLARDDGRRAAHRGGTAAQLVVVKRILSHLRRDEKQRGAFVDEARLQTLLRSPHIVRVHDLGEVDGQVYLAMEHVDGPSWRALIDRCRRSKQYIPLAYVVEMMVQAADALSYAHNLTDAGTGLPLRIVHRDVNPYNVLVTYDGQVKVIDFGIAKSDLSLQQTETGTIKGKFAYMSPEQSAAEPLDARSDLFALGICFYELVALANPFKRSNAVLSLEAIQRTSPPPPSKARPAAAMVDPIVERMLRKNPDDRFADCSEVAAALRLLQQDGLIPAPPQPLSAWLRALFAHEIEEQRRILAQTGSTGDGVATMTRAPTPPPHARASSPGPAPVGPSDADAAQTVDGAPRPVSGPVAAFAVGNTANDAGSTGPTGALQRSPRRPPIALAAALALATVVVALVALVALVAPGVRHASRSSLVDAGAAPRTTSAAVDDAGAVAALPRVHSQAPANAGLVVAADAGAVDARASAPTDTPSDAGVIDAGLAPLAMDGGAGARAGADGAAAVAVDVNVDGDAGVGPVVAGGVGPPRQKPAPAATSDIVARIAVAADGFVVKGPRTLGRRTPTVLVVDDKQAPFKLQLRLRAAADGSARVTVDSDPWAIVRVDQIGRGRTPVADVALGAGRKTLLSLQNPRGAAMDVSLTLTPAK